MPSGVRSTGLTVPLAPLAPAGLVAEAGVARLVVPPQMVMGMVGVAHRGSSRAVVGRVRPGAGIIRGLVVVLAAQVGVSRRMVLPWLAHPLGSVGLSPLAVVALRW